MGRGGKGVRLDEGGWREVRNIGMIEEFRFFFFLKKFIFIFKEWKRRIQIVGKEGERFRG